MKKNHLDAILIAVAIIVTGWCIYAGFARFSDKDRTVEVRGFSEREVEADIVTWPFVFRESGNDLSELYKNARSATQTIRLFLLKKGLTEQEFTILSPRVEDNWAGGYSNEKEVRHYQLRQTVMVKTSQVNKVRLLQHEMEELLQLGVPVSSDWDTQLQYDYTQLDSIKPAMVAEATRSARKAAEQFAKDSNSKLGKIRSATQGYFSVTNASEHTPHVKKVRVVTTVVYSLKN